MELKSLKNILNKQMSLTNFFYLVCYYLEQNGVIPPRLCGDDSFKFESNKITRWSYEVKEPDIETLSRFNSEEIDFFMKKHKVRYSSRLQFTKNLINLVLNANGLSVLLTDEDISSLVDQEDSNLF